MKKTFFISDLHLDDARPNITAEFIRFLEIDARDAKALYILGDLFESWIGDDDDSTLATMVANALTALRKTGVPIYFMHGNRDFLLGKDYADRAGLTLLQDPTVIDLDGEPTLLMHGDTMCIDDVAYQKFRQLVRNLTWQTDFLSKPLTERRAFAAMARAESTKYTGSATSEIMDVNQGAVEASMRTAGVRRLIHGHTHRPATHSLTIDGQSAERIVLGDWYEQSSVITWPRPSAVH
jgi:UDP-2,3-diacylglucosamine hydrolase